MLGTYRHITAPECRQFLLRQALKKPSTPTPTSTSWSRWAWTNGEIFNAYNEVKSIRDKDEFLIPFIEAIMDPNFHTGTPETDQTLLKSLIVFACLMEGLFFYVGFTQILALGRQNKMIGRGRAVPVHPARRVHALQLRHRPDQPAEAREPAPVDRRIQGRDQRPVPQGG